MPTQPTPADLDLAADARAASLLASGGARPPALAGRNDGALRPPAGREGRRTQLAQLRAVMARLAEALDIEDAARVLVGEAVEMIGASACAIGLLDEAGGEIEVVANSGPGREPAGREPAGREPPRREPPRREPAERWRRFPMSAEIPLAAAARSGEPIWLETREAMLAAYPTLAQARVSPELLQAAVALPLSVRRRTLGAMVFSFAEPRRFDDDEREYLLALADQGAAALDRALLYEREQQARRAIGAAGQELTATLQAAEAARAEAESARRAAEAASRAKDEFLAMLGHELRNPLAPIVTALQLMRLRGGEQAFAREIKVIQRQVDHVVRLVDDLLDVSRITRGKLQLKRTRVELFQVIQRAVEMASPLFEQRGHQLTLSVPATGLLVDGDPDRLAQVFANLLTNAARYTEPGGRVVVEAERRGADVEARVRDNGMGIAIEALTRVFELFEQGGRTLDRSQGGLGLGLSIVRSLVELHGGAVRATSDGPGRGSEFTVTLPLLDAGAPLPRRTEAPSRPDQESGLRLLLVDDNRDAIDMLAEGFRDAGHEVQVAYDPVDALELLKGFDPEVLVLDIGLPVMDGYELARRIRQMPRFAGALIIAITGYGQESDRARALEAGFNEHLVKPVSLDKLKTYLPRPHAAAPH